MPNSKYFSGTFNLVYGASRASLGVDLLVVGTAADLTGIGALFGIPVQATGAYLLVTGGLRASRGIQQLSAATRRPVLKKSPLNFSADLFIGVMPFGGKLTDVIGGMP